MRAIVLLALATHAFQPSSTRRRPQTLALHGKRAKKVDREEAWQRKKAAEAAAKIRRAGRATDLIPAAVTLGATQIEEDHRHEQFFYDEPTSRRMLARRRLRAPLVCNPSLAARRDAAGGDYLLLDRDERFASLKFRAFDLRAPEPVDYAFDALFLDPPFANVGVAELAAATRTLMGAAPRPLYVGYNAKRAAELEAAFAEFGVEKYGRGADLRRASWPATSRCSVTCNTSHNTTHQPVQ
ncbi:helicase [Aureococcus anophagefferens]|nr:helicase [Aureococcus anophagefferens]